MDLQLRGKRAIVTGGSRGIGYAAAEALAAEGVDVVLAARTRDTLDEAAARLSRDGRKVLAVTADTSDDASVRAMVAQAVSELGGIDILVNAAARPATPGAARDLAHVSDDDVRVEVETKVLGYLRCARAVAPHMVDQGWGRIINISGLAARQASGVVASLRNVSVAAMTKNLADELGRAGVNVTVVHPGLTVTERMPTLVSGYARAHGISDGDAEVAMSAGVSVGRMITAAEVADVITFLASPRSVAITGDAIAAGGGMRGTIHY